MIGWMILPLKRYAEFSGRSRRMEYWAFTLMNVVVAFVLIAMMFGAGASMGAFNQLESADPSAVIALFMGGFGLVFGLWWLAILIPSIAVVVRRLHDRDMSGWWYLGMVVASLIPFVGFIASIAFLVILLLPGTPGPNRFGPDPKDPTGAEIFA